MTKTGQTDGRTDRRTDRRATIPLRRKCPSGINKMIIIKVNCWSIVITRRNFKVILVKMTLAYQHPIVKLRIKATSIYISCILGGYSSSRNSRGLFQTEIRLKPVLLPRKSSILATLLAERKPVIINTMRSHIYALWTMTTLAQLRACCLLLYGKTDHYLNQRGSFYYQYDNLLPIPGLSGHGWMPTPVKFQNPVKFHI